MIEITGDGSHTIFSPQLNERYHSGFGALLESLHIYIRNGYRMAMKGKKCLHLLEVGLGTGLNALLTYAEAERFKIKTFYTALEPFPLPRAITEMLNYPGIIGAINMDSIFRNIHESEWNIPLKMNEYFSMNKVKERIENAELPVNHFNLVYFDAFAPRVQPELWEKVIFDKIWKAMADEGILLTYSATGSVKRNLAAAGFRVESIPGPPGKREITRAAKYYGEEI